MHHGGLLLHTTGALRLWACPYGLFWEYITFRLLKTGFAGRAGNASHRLFGPSPYDTKLHSNGGTGFQPVQTQAKPPWPFGATPNHEIPCRGGSQTAPTDGLSR